MALAVVCVLSLLLFVVLVLIWGEARVQKRVSAYWQWRYEIAAKRTEILEERLHAAWKDGYSIPSTEMMEAKRVPEEPLPPEAEDWIGQWEGVEAQEKYRKIFYQRMRSGLSAIAVIAEIENDFARG